MQQLEEVTREVRACEKDFPNPLMKFMFLKALIANFQKPMKETRLEHSLFRRNCSHPDQLGCASFIFSVSLVKASRKC